MRDGQPEPSRYGSITPSPFINLSHYLDPCGPNGVCALSGLKVASDRLLISPSPAYAIFGLSNGVLRAINSPEKNSVRFEFLQRFHFTTR